ncbi:hypothetical protein [Pseudorhodobacter sp.]|uniref:hypothetical protein n=2 Tax=Pseudorhodobacter sp. TaxID=1934400 RepID=UPI002AFEE7E7|nr:hypothetical protein [Pseudorhodobacter sp.]
MTKTPPRPVSPRQWTGLLLTTTALGASVLGAEARIAPPAGATDQTVWLAQAEGGEGGEAGAVAGVDADTAYLVRLAIVEGHLLAAAALYKAGMVDDAIGLSYHPEAEMMDDVRSTLAAHGRDDFTPLMLAFSTAMEDGATVDAMQTALAAFQDEVDAAIIADSPDAKKRFAVAVAVLKAAAAEYAGSIEGAEVTDVLAYHEAQAFVQVARNLLAGPQNDPKVADLAARALAAMEAADAAFGAANGAFVANDPAILLAVAARVELVSSQVR